MLVRFILFKLMSVQTLFCGPGTHFGGLAPHVDQNDGQKGIPRRSEPTNAIHLKVIFDTFCTRGGELFFSVFSARHFPCAVDDFLNKGMRIEGKRERK